MAQDLREVIHQLRASSGETLKPVVFGASMGGLTSIITEGESPGLIRALVLVDVTPKVELGGVKRIRDFMRGAPNGFADLDEVADTVASYQPHRERPENIEGLRKNVRQGADGRLYWHWDPAFTRSGGYIDNPDENYERLTAAAARIVVPTLLVHGAESDIVGTEGVDELLDLIPRARTVAVVEARHMIVGDDNAIFFRNVRQFLEGIGT
jgi:pimeloyl-ACP methyl ester carboxylesterase